jgi:transcriptional regulator with XRE-family HTH domain
MTTFGARVRELRRAGGFSLASLAEWVPCDKGHLSRVENDLRRPTAALVRRLDAVLGADGDLLIRAGVDECDAGGVRAVETAELLRRLRAADAAPATLEAIRSEVTELCCQYAWRDPRSLRREAHAWFREAARLLHRSVGLAAHRELLVAAGWLALLTGCLENDLGLTHGAEATRAAARRLGDEAGHAGIVAWS